MHTTQHVQSTHAHAQAAAGPGGNVPLVAPCPLVPPASQAVEVVLVNMAGEAPPERMALDMSSGSTVRDLAVAAARSAGLPGV